jgi:hypothetical protein
MMPPNPNYLLINRTFWSMKECGPMKGISQDMHPHGKDLGNSRVFCENWASDKPFMLRRLKYLIKLFLQLIWKQTVTKFPWKTEWPHSIPPQQGYWTGYLWSGWNYCKPRKTERDWDRVCLPTKPDNIKEQIKLGEKRKEMLVKITRSWCGIICFMLTPLEKRCTKNLVQSW